MCGESNRKSNVTFIDPFTGAKSIVMEPSKFIGGHNIARDQIRFLKNLANWEPNTIHFTLSERFKNAKQKRMKNTGLWLLDDANECQ